ASAAAGTTRAVSATPRRSATTARGAVTGVVEPGPVRRAGRQAAPAPRPRAATDPASSRPRPSRSARRPPRARSSPRKAPAAPSSRGALQHEGRALAATDAERRETQPNVAASHLAKERQDESRPRDTDGMAERDGAAVHVQDRAVDLPDGSVEPEL